MAYCVMDGLHRLGLTHPMAWRVSAALAFMTAALSSFGLGVSLFKVLFHNAMALITLPVIGIFLAYLAFPPVFDMGLDTNNIGQKIGSVYALMS